MGRRHLLLGRQNLCFSTMSVKNGSPNCVIFCVWQVTTKRWEQITPRPVFWRKKLPQPVTEDFHQLVLPYFQQKNSLIVMPTTRLKSSTTRSRVATRRLRNAALCRVYLEKSVSPSIENCMKVLYLCSIFINLSLAISVVNDNKALDFLL